MTRVLTCPVNVAAMRRYVREAGPEADAPRADGLGTLRERARTFLHALGRNTAVRISYRHCQLGAALIAAGYSYAPLASMPAEGMWTPSDSHEPCATSPLLAAAMTWTTRPPTLALASMSFNRDVHSPGYSLLTVSRSSPRWDFFSRAPYLDARAT